MQSNSTDKLSQLNQKVFAFPAVKGKDSPIIQRPASNNLKRVLAVVPFENSFDRRNFFTPKTKQEHSLNDSRLPTAANRSRQHFLGQTFSTLSVPRLNSRKESNNVSQYSEIFVTKGFNGSSATDLHKAAIRAPSRQYSAAELQRPTTVNLQSFIFQDSTGSKLTTPNDSVTQDLQSSMLQSSKAFSQEKPSRILGLNLHYNPREDFPVPNVAIEKDLYTQQLGTKPHQPIEELKNIVIAGKMQKRRSIYHDLHHRKPQENSRQFKIIKDANMKYRLNLDYQHQRAIYQKNNETDFEALIRAHSEELMVVVDIPSYRLMYTFIERERGGKIKIYRFPDHELKLIIANIRQKLKLNPEFRHLYLLNGQSIFELQQIPLSESVVVLSDSPEFSDCERILRYNLVNDFYHYGKREYEMKKQRTQYSGAALSSGASTSYEQKATVSSKVKGVLSKILSKNSPNGDDLERLDKFLEENPKKIRYSQLLDNLLQDENPPASGKHSAGEESKGVKEIAGNFSNLVSSFVKDNEDQIMDQEDNKGNETNALEDQISSYLQEKSSPYTSQKFHKINRIYKIYKSDMKNMTISQEEVEEDSLNGFQQMQKEIQETDEAEKIDLDEIIKELDPLLKELKNPSKKLDYFQEKKEQQQNQLKTKLNSTTPSSEMAELDASVNPHKPKIIERPTQEKNYVEKNIKALRSKKTNILNLKKANRELFEKNIPKYMKELNLSRKELHLVWIIYKALCEVTSQRHENYSIEGLNKLVNCSPFKSDVESGVDYHTFRNGIYQVFLQSEEVAESIFYNIDINYSGFLNWKEFLQAMVKIRANTLKDKIDMFIKVADQDGNQMLSKDEIYNLCKICLGKFVRQQDDDFLNSLCEYFTKFIFQSVDVDPADDIPLKKLRDCILKGGEDSALLAMFCGADL